ncbi:HK97 family phage prohead protease [Latilactobacillus sakei]
MPKMETRAINTDLTASDDETRTVSGTAVVFNRDSEDLGGFIEKVNSHAFDGVDLKDVFMLFNHDYDSVLCRTIANTLELTLDDARLTF